MNVLTRLVKRLPLMICPAWTATESEPVYLDDVVESLCYAVKAENLDSSPYDLVGPTRLTYREMMEEVARLLGLKRWMLTVPFVSPAFSRLWVSYFTGAPRALIAPLIASLRHTMTSQPATRFEIPGYNFTPFEDAIALSLKNESEGGAKEPHAFKKQESGPASHSVRSVQRLHLPSTLRATDVTELYMNWLPQFLKPFIRVEVDGHFAIFYLPLVKSPVLILELSDERSSEDRRLFYIRGGLLARKEGRARLEFREVLGGKAIITAIHDYFPTLPWRVYLLSQARVHLFVMKGFNRHLRQMG